MSVMDQALATCSFGMARNLMKVGLSLMVPKGAMRMTSPQVVMILDMPSLPLV